MDCRAGRHPEVSVTKSNNADFQTLEKGVPALEGASVNCDYRLLESQSILMQYIYSADVAAEGMGFSLSVLAHITRNYCQVGPSG